LHAAKRFNLYYSNQLKTVIKKQVLKANSNKFNQRLFFIKYFESRLDTVLCRAKFCVSIRQAQQYILHGKVLVNNCVIKSKSFVLKPGDLISFKLKQSNKIRNNILHYCFNKFQSKFYIPKHLCVNHKTLQIIYNELENTHFASIIQYNMQLEQILLDYKYH